MANRVTRDGICLLVWSVSATSVTLTLWTYSDEEADVNNQDLSDPLDQTSSPLNTGTSLLALLPLA